MDEFHFRRHDRAQERQLHPNLGEGIHFVLSGEEKILQSISACAPLPEVLNGICCALDSHIGNVVSLFCLREDDAADLAAIARNPKHFGLYTFCSAGVFTENDELLGTLEMYCCDLRSLSMEEIHLIERATCLATIAIKHYMETRDDGICSRNGDQPLRRYVLKWPDSMN